MKKLFLIIAVIVPLFCVGQTNRYWNYTLVVDHALDTVIYMPSSDVAKYSMTLTAETVDLTGIFYFGIGSSNNQLSTGVYGFEFFPVDSIPYTFDASKCDVVTNGVTTVQKTWNSFGDKIGVLTPGIWIKTDVDIAFTLNINAVLSY